MGKMCSLKNITERRKYFLKIKNNNINEENKPVDQLVEWFGVVFQCHYGGSLALLFLPNPPVLSVSSCLI
jgi:hypothetical protein